MCSFHRCACTLRRDKATQQQKDNLLHCCQMGIQKMIGGTAYHHTIKIPPKMRRVEWRLRRYGLVNDRPVGQPFLEQKLCSSGERRGLWGCQPVGPILYELRRFWEEYGDKGPGFSKHDPNVNCSNELARWCHKLHERFARRTLLPDQVLKLHSIGLRMANKIANSLSIKYRK
ncbi:hypothetical protein CVIRNUC_007214 [Coccomyxa viridis]|uniref:LAGLIDADG homing endonuclease n=1 Tax=Coccomyxa viridis TaxID=1274662 RepID=A0AAV1IBA9_9CHLO|nr:hypothetical protein CVIRNUC_007214 [Coccomyxa viridis]